MYAYREGKEKETKTEKEKASEKERKRKRERERKRIMRILHIAYASVFSGYPKKMRS